MNEEERERVLGLFREKGLSPQDALKYLNDELARTSLVDFGKLTYSNFQAPSHIMYLADLLERAERGEILNLCISCPPGHGKSTLLQNFVAWFLGRDPRRRILAVSASESLARRNSRAIRSTIQSDKWPWPNVKLLGESLEEWHTAQNGGTRAIGVDGTVTGFRAEMLLCDDIQPDAGNDASRKALEERFREVFLSRREPGAITVIINTRWHDADIIGRLKAGGDADKWVFINLPALAVEPDLLERAPGEALWPERWSVELLEEQRASLTPVPFSAQYQGDPVPAGGALFKTEWLEHSYDELPRTTVVQPMVDTRNAFERAIDPRPPSRSMGPIVIQSVDSAWKTGTHNDRSVIATLMTDLREIYIQNIWMGRVAYTDLKRICEDQFDQYTPRTIYVEEASSGYALIDEFKRGPGKILPVVAVKPGHDDKIARAESVTGWFESGRIKFPKSASWLPETMMEFRRFPFAAHDDTVDAIVRGIIQLQLIIARVNLSNRQQSSQANDFNGWMSR